MTLNFNSFLNRKDKPLPQSIKRLKLPRKDLTNIKNCSIVGLSSTRKNSFSGNVERTKAGK